MKTDMQADLEPAKCKEDNHLKAQLKQPYTETMEKRQSHRLMDQKNKQENFKLEKTEFSILNMKRACRK